MAAKLEGWRLASALGPAERFWAPNEAHALGWPELDALLPDGGFPEGLIELTAAHALGGATSVALAAIRAAQKRSEHMYCAWIDAYESLYAPGVARSGVDLDRLLVVRPRLADVPRIANKIASSNLISVLVLDIDAPGGSMDPSRSSDKERHCAMNRVRRPIPIERWVRKLALATERAKKQIILISDARKKRAALSVKLRLGCRLRPDAFGLRIDKDRMARRSSDWSWVPLSSVPWLGASSCAR